MIFVLLNGNILGDKEVFSVMSETVPGHYFFLFLTRF